MTERRGWVRRLVSVLSGIGIAVACVSGPLGVYSARLELETGTAAGEVVEVQRLGDGGSVPTIGFTAPDGGQHRFIGLERDSTPWRVGDPVGVRYDPRQPANAHADDALSRWWFPASLLVLCALSALPHVLRRRRRAGPVFRRQAGEQVRLATMLWCRQGDGGMALRQLYLTDRRIVLGRQRLSAALVRFGATVFLASEASSLVPVVPQGWRLLVSGAAGLAMAHWASRGGPVVQQYGVSSIAGLRITDTAQWWRTNGVVVRFDDGQAWTLQSAQRGARNARPYADCISAASGRPIED